MTAAAELNVLLKALQISSIWNLVPSLHLPWKQTVNSQYHFMSRWICRLFTRAFCSRFEWGRPATFTSLYSYIEEVVVKHSVINSHDHKDCKGQMFPTCWTISSAHLHFLICNCDSAFEDTWVSVQACASAHVCCRWEQTPVHLHPHPSERQSVSTCRSVGNEPGGGRERVQTQQTMARWGDSW